MAESRDRHEHSDRRAPSPALLKALDHLKPLGDLGEWIMKKTWREVAAALVLIGTLAVPVVIVDRDLQQKSADEDAEVALTKAVVVKEKDLGNGKYELTFPADMPFTPAQARHAIMNSTSMQQYPNFKQVVYINEKGASISKEMWTPEFGKIVSCTFEVERKKD